MFAGREGATILQVEIPDSVAHGLRLPAPEVAPRLRKELAIALYSQGILGFGKASEFIELPRFSFAGVIAERGIPRHYTENELSQDLDYARRQ